MDGFKLGGEAFRANTAAELRRNVWKMNHYKDGYQLILSTKEAFHMLLEAEKKKVSSLAKEKYQFQGMTRGVQFLHEHTFHYQYTFHYVSPHSAPYLKNYQQSRFSKTKGGWTVS